MTPLSAQNMNNIEDGIEELQNGKVDKESGKGLSTNDYTTAEKNKLAGINASVVDLIYPVGSIYMSVSSTNPGTVFGRGTWVAWGSGRVPVGVNTSDGSFNTAEKIGGEKEHTLDITEIPRHSHGLGYVMGIDGATPYDFNVSETYQTKFDYSIFSATGESGYGGSHNNLQPYITCYMWKRTA